MSFQRGRGRWLAGAATIALMIASGQAQAGGFAPREQSAEGQGASFAGVAAGAGGLSSMFWNPATLTNIEGIQSSWQISGLLNFASDTPFGPQTALNPPVTAVGTGNILGGALLPSSYSSIQLTDRLWFGLAMNTPFGLGSRNPRPSAPQLYGLTTTVFSEDINPSIAYKVTDWLSVGVGIELMYFKVRQTQAGSLGAAPPVGILKGDSWGFGMTAGATIKPWQGGEIGIGYRSMVRQNVEGTINSPLILGGSFAQPVATTFDLPETVTIGLRQRIAPQITLLAGFDWTNWSRIKTVRVSSTGGVIPVGAVIQTQNLNYKNGWMASLGAEYQWNPQWTFRAGLAYERAPLDDTNRGVTLLDGDRTWASIGASYKYNQKLSFDLAYSHVFVKSGLITIPAGGGLPGYNGATRGHSDILSLGLNYRWDDPKVAAPIFAKY